MYISLVSIWSWAVLATCLVVWLPILALIRLVTLPFDRGRYWAGFFFRKIAVVTVGSNLAATIGIPALARAKSGRIPNATQG